MATGSRRRRTRTSAVEIAGIKQQASVAGEPPSVSLVILSALPSATSACIFIRHITNSGVKMERATTMAAVVKGAPPGRISHAGAGGGVLDC
uniref:Uncharacterized protein n=2 Tax=Oryza sativa subsp. japonica TaxID=39947 RepID=Q75LQ5_ORYSJ|nr:hypothetical protein [Oryza sativa Japonica Group]ABF96346.1 hypothetical protein LOC_Os03g27160 [Oryza sativa Japonica Group]